MMTPDDSSQKRDASMAAGIDSDHDTLPDLLAVDRRSRVEFGATRRRFLKASATLTAGLVGVPWLGRLAGAEMAAGTIIDTHTHFYDPTRPQGVPWPDKGDRLLYRKVLPPDYRALPQPRKVTGTVVVEASSWVEDNQWVLDLAANDPFIVGMVGNLTPGSDAFSGQLRRFAGNPLFRGIRIGGDRLGAAVGEASFRKDLGRLADAGLELDVNGSPESLPGVARLAAEVPDLRIVINHVANVRIDGRAAPADWLRGMNAASQKPHVYCKVSGLVEGSGRADGKAPADVEFYRPILDGIWNAFGADRLIYGSNWPVSERFAPCGVVQGIVSGYFQTRGPAAVEKVFWRNASAAYRWVTRAR